MRFVFEGPMTKAPASLIAILSVSLLSSCSNPHFFPRLRPLFPGLEEANLSCDAQNSLSQAKTDFMLVKHGKTPQHATLISSIPHTRSRLYEGQGYRLTSVRKDNIYPHRTGPEIVISPKITGGKAYHYDEVDEVAE
jgi:hypothetical protein